MRVNSIADLGCGIGYTTATLKEVFNCRVTGTNIRDTKQYKVCEVLRKKVDFDLTDNIEEIGNVDLVFASEYFEHFEKPVEHLKYVIEN
jgi:cyclopropane fatty-acyl-phospholipid synthase-like methyltransferase